MPPKKTANTAKLTIDTPFDKAGKLTPRMVMKNDTEPRSEENLKVQIMDPWPSPFENERKKSLILIDYETFGDHKWFQDFYALSDSQRTAAKFKEAANAFVKIRNFYVFLRPRKLSAFVDGVKNFVYWCRYKRNGDFSMNDGYTIRDYFEWLFDETKPAGEPAYHPDKNSKNKHLSRYAEIRRKSRPLNEIMEIQGWLSYKPIKGSKVNATLPVTMLSGIVEYRAMLLLRANEVADVTNVPVGEARNEVKVLDSDQVELFVKYFNMMDAITNTYDGKWAALAKYAILSFNFNLGFRGAAAMNICYSWFKYVEEPMTVTGLYLNIGNRKGMKMKNVELNFAQYIVRHEDVRQCTIGALIKIIVAEHDIIKDTSLLDQVEECIRERELYVERHHQGQQLTVPKWYDYKVLRNRNENGNESISYAVYNTAVKDAYSAIGAEEMKAIAHEPHNRVPVNMLKMGIPEEKISLFMAWTTENATQFEKLYKHGGIDVVSALARSNHPHFEQRIYICPRDGVNSDFDSYPEIRAKVLGGRVPGLLQRANAVNALLREMNIPLEDRKIQTTLIFLEMLNNYLIRVWLEDAAILWKAFPHCICYKGHPVFGEERWPELVDHLEELRTKRGGDLHEVTPVSNASFGQNHEYIPLDDDTLTLYEMMRVKNTSATIESLYDWRHELKNHWQQMHPKDKKGIPDELWGNAHATNNQILYQRIRRLYDYIQNTSVDKKWDVKHTISKIQAAVDHLELSAKDFASTQFRILTGLGEKGTEKNLLEITRVQLDAAFKKYGLPAPPQVKETK